MKQLIRILIVLSVLHGSTACKDQSREQCIIVVEGQRELLREGVCETPLAPASTFEIPLALIALEAKVARPTETVPWDGYEHPFPAWNHDQNLAGAVRHGVPWYFQEVASRIEPETMRQGLQAFAIGPGNLTANPTMFWLNGDLKLSASVQLEFLRKFFTAGLPFVQARHQKTVIELIRQKPGTLANPGGEADFALTDSGDVFAKTGFLALPDGSRVNWCVGQVRRDGRSPVFVSVVSGTDESIAGLTAARLVRERLAPLLSGPGP